jgi:hypothetical protein
MHAHPPNAERYLITVCTPDCPEAVLADCERNFIRHAARHGEKSARRWHWRPTMSTGGVFGVQTVVNLVMLLVLPRKLGLWNLGCVRLSSGRARGAVGRIPLLPEAAVPT